jgi:hypothetical protein
LNLSNSNPSFMMFSVPDNELAALVCDGHATIPQEREYAWRVTVASWLGNARTCDRFHPGCALAPDGPCSIDPRAFGEDQHASRRL